MFAGRILQTTLSVAVVLATLFTGFTPKFFTGDLSSRIALLLTPQPDSIEPIVPTSQYTIRIGIVAGHWGNDSGSVCSDGTTEAEVNQAIAELVQQKLAAQGFKVDLLQEFDPRLSGYRAAVLVSIHNDSCTYINDQATGFKVVAAKSSRDQNLAGRLTACLIDRYQRDSSLPFHPGSITQDMTEYHAFAEIDPATTAAIIEAGFLNLDYALLTQHTDQVAAGIVAGVMCYVNSESVAPPSPTPVLAQ